MVFLFSGWSMWWGREWSRSSLLQLCLLCCTIHISTCGRNTAHGVGVQPTTHALAVTDIANKSLVRPQIICSILCFYLLDTPPYIIRDLVCTLVCYFVGQVIPVIGQSVEVKKRHSKVAAKMETLIKNALYHWWYIFSIKTNASLIGI